MQYRALLPNALTMANLVCGCLAIHLLYSTGSYYTAALLIGLAAVLDVFDGLAARMLRVAGGLGQQLDSLADAVTFGVAPALMVVKLLSSMTYDLHPVQMYLPLLLAVASVYRLAKFNLDSRQTEGFRGLPTPANALFWIAVCHLYASGHEWGVMVRPITVLPTVVVMSLWMVSDLPLIALKFKKGGFAANRYRYLMVTSGGATAIASYLVFGSVFPAVPIVLLLYLLISLLSQRSNSPS